jgi:YjbE family integral membrane protein
MMDLGMFGTIEFTWAFCTSFLSIILIDLVLAGDNAVVIAMAVKTLPRKKRLLGTAIGAGGAVVLRVACTFIVAQLLVMKYVKLAGGAVIVWIAIKLLVQGVEEEDGSHKEAASIFQALWVIMVADISMSIDNMLAVAGACKGNLFLLLFGLGLSIPFVVFTSNLLAMLMDKYPVILYIGAAILGRVAGDMMITDPFVHTLLDPSKHVEYGAQAFFTVAVIVVSQIIIRRQAAKAKVEGIASGSSAETQTRGSASD